MTEVGPPDWPMTQAPFNCAMINFSFCLWLLRLTVATQHIHQLVAYQFLNVGTGGLQVLAGVKLIGVLGVELTDGTSHSQAQVGIDINLAHGALGCLSKLLLGDSHRVRHLTAIGVDHFYILLGHAGRPMKYDRKAGQTLNDLVQDVKAQGRGNQLTLLIAGTLGGSDFIRAVAGADGNSQGIATSLGHKLLDFLRAGIVGLLSRNVDLVLYARQGPQFCLDDNTVIMGILHHSLGDLNVLGKRLGGRVDHDGGEASVDAALAGLKAVAMIQVEHDGDLRALNDSSLHQLHQIGVVGIGTGTFGHLENDWGLFLPTGLSDSLDDLHVVDVEGTNGIAAIISLFEHFSRSNQWHNCPTPYQNLIWAISVMILTFIIKKCKQKLYFSKVKTHKTAKNFAGRCQQSDSCHIMVGKGGGQYDPTAPI